MISTVQAEIGTVLVFFGTFFIYWIYRESKPPKNYPPGPRPLPFIGNLHSIAIRGTNMLKTFRELSEQYGPVVGLRLGSRHAVVLNSVDAIKEAFLKNGDTLSDRPSYIYMIRSIVWRKGQPRGVIWQNGVHWRDTRRFTLQSLRDFGVGKRSIEERIQEEAKFLCEEISKYNNKPCNITEISQESVSNIICSICFGARFEYSDSRFQHLMSLIRFNVAAATFLAPVNFFPWLRHFSSQEWVLQLRNNILAIEDFVWDQIKEHRESFDKKDVRDFVDLYLKKEDEGYDDQNVYSTINLQRVITDLFIAGTETTSTTIRWLLLYMCKYPVLQQRCQKDIDDVIGSSRVPCLSDRVELPFIEAVINETLRVAAAVPLGVPHVAERDTTILQYKIPKDTLILAILNSANNDPAYWKDPDEFRPGRWLDEEGRFVKRDGMLTFSTGPRTCIGETLARNELFIFFCSLMQRFNLTLPQGSSLDINANVGITFAPKAHDLLFTPR